MSVSVAQSHPSSLVTRPRPSGFAVADQGRGTYTVHEFDSWEHFRLWCRTHRPKHMTALTSVRGTRKYPDVDHRGEYTEQMLHVQAQDDRKEARREERHARIVRLGHDADADPVALYDTRVAKRQARRSKIRSRQGLFNWCIENNINFDVVPNLLGMPLRRWEILNPEDPYDKAVMAIELRRDAQAHPETE